MAVKAYEMKLTCGAGGDPGCGREVTGAAPYAMHRRKCPVALGQTTSGRIQASQLGSTPRLAKPSQDRTPPRGEAAASCFAPSSEGEKEDARRVA